jgi:hypothetical protein
MPASPDESAVREYLDWWFGMALADPEAPARIVLATMVRGKQYEGSEEFVDIPTAASWGAKRAATVDVYTHAALHTPKGPERLTMRGNMDSAVALSGLLVDLDADSPHRASHVGYAPDVAGLWLLVADFERAYQHKLTVVQSGYGLLALSRFREPLWLTDRAGREEADELLKRYAEGWRVLAKQRGWPAAVGPIGLADLSRLAGTTNRKGQPRAVSLCSRGNGATAA